MSKKENPFREFAEKTKEIRKRPPSKEVIDRINNRVRKAEEELNITTQTGEIK